MTPELARARLAEAVHRIAPEARLDEVDDDEPFRDALDLDSMDFLNLVSAIHESTGIDIAERDYPAVATLGGFVDHLVRASS